MLALPPLHSEGVEYLIDQGSKARGDHGECALGAYGNSGVLGYTCDAVAPSDSQQDETKSASSVMRISHAASVPS